MRGAAEDTRDDTTLLAACLGGERRAWTTLVERTSRYVAWLIRLTAQRCGVELDDDTVGDFHAEVYAALLEDDMRRLRLYRGENGCSVRSWLRVIAVRRTLDLLRKRRPETSLDQLVEQGAQWTDTATPDALTALIETRDPGPREALEAAAALLSESDRALLEMLYVHKLPAEAAATALGINRGALYTRKTRLVQRLQALVEGGEDRGSSKKPAVSL